MLVWSKLLVFTSKKLALRVYSYILKYRPLSLMSFSHPPDVTHVMVRPGLPHFSRSSASVYYTEHKTKNKKRGRPGNKASDNLCNLVFNVSG